MGWAVGWDNSGGAQVVFGSVQVAAGDPAGLDTTAAGALAIGGVNATSVNVDPPTTFDSLLTSLAGFTNSGGDLNTGGHIVSSTVGAPVTSALGANVTSATFTGNDTVGTIAIVMSAGLAANTRVCTATFAVSYGATPPKVTLVDQTSAVGLTVVNSYVLAQATGVSFDIAFDQALVAGTYIIDYIVIG